MNEVPIGYVDYDRVKTQVTLQSAKETKAIRDELEKFRDEYAKYQSYTKAEREKDREENAEAHKKITRRSWAQTIAAATLGPLLTLFIEHFDDIRSFLTTYFGH